MSLPIIDAGTGSGGCFTTDMEALPLPEKYMEDYSVMGLVVGNMDKSIHVLRKGGTTIRRDRGYAVADIRDSAHMRRIFAILDSHRVSFEFSDIANQIYQG